VALATAACARPTNSNQPQNIGVTIGVPESNAAGELVGIGQFVGALSLEGLVKVGDDGHAVPWLAASWAWENDSSQLRIKLRPGVFFHDGTPLDAELAATLLKQAIDLPANRSLFPALNDIATVGTDGDLDLILKLSRISPLLPNDLGMQLRKENNVGTGPYLVESTDPKQLVLKRFDQYYLGKPTIEEVVVKPFDTLRTAWTSLLRGEVDVVSDVPADAVEFIRNEEVQVVPYGRRYQYLIAFNSGKGPLRSPAVRRALNLAIDRAGLIEKVLEGSGTVSTGPIWPNYWAYDGAVQPYGFAPEQAAALLDDAGYSVRPATAGRPPARFRFKCLIPENYAVQERIALEVQRNLLDIGVDMEIVPLSIGEFFKRLPQSDFESALMDMNSGPTPGRAYVFWRSRRAFKGEYNVFGYENAEAEKLFRVLNTSASDAAVRSATLRLQQVLLNDPPALFLAWNARARAIRHAFVIPEGGGDPLNSLWKWTPAPGARPATTP
jgi:peptide/nickel transport system substrate-binding protein